MRSTITLILSNVFNPIEANKYKYREILQATKTTNKRTDDKIYYYILIYEVVTIIFNILRKYTENINETINVLMLQASNRELFVTNIMPLIKHKITDQLFSSICKL